MTSRLSRNLRKGHLAEDIGVNVFRGFCAVAEMPNKDDLGIDAYCVLLRQEGRLLISDSPLFGVQFKTISTTTIDYEPHSVEWFINMETPLFYCLVDAKNARVRCFSANRYRRMLYLNKSISKVVLDFTYDSVENENGILRVGMNPPIFECTELEARTDDFASSVHNLLSKWIEFEQEAIRLQKYQIYKTMRWETGQEPNYFFSTTATSPENFTQVLQKALPIVEKLAFQSMGDMAMDPQLPLAFKVVVQWYLDRGFNIDEMLLEFLQNTADLWESQ